MTRSARRVATAEHAAGSVASPFVSAAYASLRDYFAELRAAHGGDASTIWSIDGVHVPYVP